MVLGHPETLYAEIGTRIANATFDVTADVKAAADAELKAAAARTRAELAKSVAQTELDIADRGAGVNRLQWNHIVRDGAGVIFLTSRIRAAGSRAWLSRP